MIDPTEDLWPSDIAAEKIQTPVSILRTQAARLGQKTSNLVEGQVDTMAHERRIIHRFRLVAPALDNFAYDLFRISHPATLYPITIDGEPEDTAYKIIPIGGRQLNSEKELVEWLREVFASKETKRIVSSIVSQSAAWEPALKS